MSAITARPMEAKDWEAASGWWTSRWSLPRGERPPATAAEDYPLAFELSGQLVGIGGLVDQMLLPPGRARLSLALSPDIANLWQVYACVKLLLAHAFAVGSDCAMVVGQCRRDDDFPLYASWRMLVDRLTRDMPKVIAAGGWHHDADGAALPQDLRADPDKCPLLYWDWVRQ